MFLSSPAALLDTACKVLPLVVTVSGRVGSDTPIHCEQSGLRGVIIEETVYNFPILSLVETFFGELYKCSSNYVGTLFDAFIRQSSTF